MTRKERMKNRHKQEFGLGHGLGVKDCTNCNFREKDKGSFPCNSCTQGGNIRAKVNLWEG